MPDGTTAESGPDLVDRALERRLAVVGTGCSFGPGGRVVGRPVEERALVTGHHRPTDELLPRDEVEDGPDEYPDED